MDFNYVEKSNVSIVCPCCEEEFLVGIKADLEEESSYERAMGLETQYGFTQETQCPNCGKLLEIEGEVWEYPEGAENLFQIVRVNSNC